MYVNDTQTERERESKMSTHKQNKETKTSNETEQTRWVGGRKKKSTYEKMWWDETS